MPDLTIRNLTTCRLRIRHTTSFFQGPPKPAPITVQNITNVKNITANASSFASSLFSKTSLSKRNTLPPAPTPPPKLENRATDIRIDPYSTLHESPIIPYPEHTSVTIEFTLDDDHEFNIVLPPHSNTDVVFPDVPRKSGEIHSLYAVLHRSRAHLAIVSSANLDEWMSRLPSRLPLASLSIPGTHNSATHYVALPSVRCQAVDIPTQLNNGIRFLDVRVQPDEALNLVHGVFPISISGLKPLKGLTDAVYDFLAKHPRECIIVSLKREGRDVGVDDRGFSKRIWEEVITPAKDKWWTLERIPTLGEARGKIILFRRFEKHDPALELGIDAECWAYNTANDVHGAVCVQDFCEVLETQNIDIKVTHVREHLKRAAVATEVAARSSAAETVAQRERERELEERLKREQEQAEEAQKEGAAEGAAEDQEEVQIQELAPQPQENESDMKSTLLYVNFLSASNFWKVGCWPDRIAKKINPQVQWELAAEHEAGKGTGVVVLDFVGENDEWGICRLVVGMNGGLLK